MTRESGESAMADKKTRRPDGYEPYRDRQKPARLGQADFRDGRPHPEADEQHYGEAPKKAPPGKPSMPAVKTQR
jgi:hypothetical protein